MVQSKNLFWADNVLGGGSEDGGYETRFWIGRGADIDGVLTAILEHGGQLASDAYVKKFPGRAVCLIGAKCARIVEPPNGIEPLYKVDYVKRCVERKKAVALELYLAKDGKQAKDVLKLGKRRRQT